eukprot:scaffold39731_cov51-Phaeocystis_antarctica.AAC.2
MLGAGLATSAAPRRRVAHAAGAALAPSCRVPPPPPDARSEPVLPAPPLPSCCRSSPAAPHLEKGASSADPRPLARLLLTLQQGCWTGSAATRRSGRPPDLGS